MEKAGRLAWFQGIQWSPVPLWSSTARTWGRTGRCSWSRRPRGPPPRTGSRSGRTGCYGSDSGCSTCRRRRRTSGSRPGAWPRPSRSRCYPRRCSAGCHRHRQGVLGGALRVIRTRSTRRSAGRTSRTSCYAHVEAAVRSPLTAGDGRAFGRREAVLGGLGGPGRGGGEIAGHVRTPARAPASAAC